MHTYDSRPGNYMRVCLSIYAYTQTNLDFVSKVCITYGNKDLSCRRAYFFLPLWWMRACLCVWSKLFVHIKEAWLKNFGVPFFWILKFSRLLHVTASGVLFYTVICCFTLQFHNNKIAIENITRLLNYPATIANCHIIPTSKIAKV